MVVTYRYLRVAMVVLVVGLAAAVLRELAAVGWSCAQESVSAYYYTPARAVLVGVLVAIGACLVVIKGSTGPEDVLLNLAGMLAPVVAFVPTPYLASCYSTDLGAARVGANVANNMFALLVMGAVVLVATAVLARQGPAAMDRRVFTLGAVAALALLVGFGLTFVVARTSSSTTRTTPRRWACSVASSPSRG